MKSRLPVVGVAVILAVLVGALAWTLSAPIAATITATVIGGIVGAILGQALMWSRASVGRSARIEHALQHRLEGMRSIADKRHEILTRAIRETRDRAANAEREAQRAAGVLPQMRESAKHTEQTLRDMRISINDKVDDQVVLLEDYMQLMRLVPMPLPMPRPGTWAASEDLLLWLAGYVVEHRPSLVVDLGSGQSSVWMAGAMRVAGYDGRVIGVDHDAHFAEATRVLAQRQGVDTWLSVIHAPLVTEDIGGRRVTWYDQGALADLTGIDLLCIDGPPGQGVAQARWPALLALRDRLSVGATVVLDDMIRRDEQEIADDWLCRYPEFTVERFAFEKGAAVLSLPPA
ncbi:MAG: class I SAM-dependent methyltransferase [Candidatus Nanopelagicales bacterium]|jgi:predicted O-methyltransferase YrrM|nr:class I SAM-dependent methyltransferase [Candidatus Nanopelagicales bacterium]MDP4715327.1 class I SAM-dependent methyltransferase [Candidatus Nanopelagicales bacterium]MDP4907072.1 class I SAM-dependent methyltransferase [Candidatus Nanopelagicales bacterium]MDP4908019.1 class I SAM-dependent methyltransferase [Candidatus Nanopelagicales bacterium]MDP4974250.1 class I SAM-dependent methyltransferase [Candidatus Nanopelagicales bacterium]